ncbi:hypothetical protein BK144_08260 [Paenibacillus sp. FSL R7-0273]|nr:hypothetical protein BK144_08260 [Paenibacillus sp. FSL R7-0273]
MARNRYNNYVQAKWSESSWDEFDAAEEIKIHKKGAHFEQSGRTTVLKPSNSYSKNGYKYKTDTLGRITKVEGDLVLKAAERNSYAQRAAGRSDRIRANDLVPPYSAQPEKYADAGGHLIASRFNGSGELDNLVAMNGQINGSGGKWYELEELWANAIDKRKLNVNVKIELKYSNNSLRPDEFLITYQIGSEEIEKVTIRNQYGG